MDDNVDELSFSVRLPEIQQSFGGDDPVYLKADLHESDFRIHDLLDRLPAHSNRVNRRSLTLESSTYVQACFPDLWQLARTINKLLRRGVSTLIVENLPFARLDLARSKQALLAFASCIGRPVSADPHRPILSGRYAQSPGCLQITHQLSLSTAKTRHSIPTRLSNAHRKRTLCCSHTNRHPREADCRKCFLRNVS